MLIHYIVEKYRWELHKDTVYCFEQILEAAPNKTAVLQPLTSHLYQFIGLVVKVFANGPGDLGSIPGCVISKTLKMVPDTSLLNTQQYKVCIKGKVEKSRERSSALP